jgi:hypothetical protein
MFAIEHAAASAAVVIRKNMEDFLYIPGLMTYMGVEKQASGRQPRRIFA